MVDEQDQRECIYIVDDDPGMRQALERLFTVSGWKARTFATGELLLESRSGSDAACYVIDLHLPGASGFELWAQLSMQGIDRPVVFITGQDRESSRHLAEQIGAAGYFIKPFQGRDLVETVKKSARH